MMWTALGALAVLALLGVVARLAATRYFDRAALSSRIATLVAERLGGRVHIDEIQFAILPAPHVVLSEINVAIPASVSGTIHRISAYPRLGALFRGRLELATLHVTRPDLRFNVAHRPEEPADSDPESFADLQKRTLAAVVDSVGGAAAQAPNLVVTVDGGSVKVHLDHDPSLTFSNVHGLVHLPPGQLQFELAAGSNLWDMLEIEGSVDAATLRGDLRATVEALHPQELDPFLTADSPIELVGSDVTLQAEVTLNGPTAIHGALTATNPAIQLQRDGRSVTLQATELAATLAADEQELAVDVRELALTTPAVQLSGRLSLDHVQHRLHLRLTLRDADATALREASIALAEDNPVVGRVFDIVRGGQVPRLEFEAQAPDVAGLGQLTAMQLHGNLTNGLIHVPGLDLDFADVAGDVAIADGVLQGEHVSGRQGDILTTDARLRIGLTGDAPIRQVDASVQANAADLPPLLRHIAADTAVVRQLDNVTEVAGTATGRILVDGTIDRVSTTVEVSSFALSARVAGVPDPVHLQGGQLAFNAQELVASDVLVRTGQQSLSACGARLGLDTAPPIIDLSCGVSRFGLADLHSWAMAAGWRPTSEWDPREIRGTATLTSAALRGPLATPDAWHLELIGDIDDLEVDIPILAEALALRDPVLVSKLHVVRDQRAGTTATGRLTEPSGLTGDFDLAWVGDAFDLRTLHIRDRQSDAKMSLRLSPGIVDLAFAGRLERASLDTLVQHNNLLGGSLYGDFRSHLALDDPDSSTATGTVKATDLRIPTGYGPSPQVSVDTLTVTATARAVDVDAAVTLAANSHVRARGSVHPWAKTFTVDLDISADRVNWAQLAPWFEPDDALDASTGGRPNVSDKGLPLQGSVRIALDAFTYDRFTWEPLRATATLSPSGVTLAVRDAQVCGVSTLGTIAFASHQVQVTLQPRAKQQALAAMFTCVLERSEAIDGQYDLAGNLTARGTSSTLWRSSRGHFDVRAANGRIYSASFLARVFTVLGAVADPFRDLSNLTKTGMPYDRLTLSGDLDGGTLTFTEAVLEGPAAKMVAEGKIELAERTIDLMVLVAPLKTVNTLIGWIPVIGTIAGGNFISVPVRVSGPLDDPVITPLSPSAVGERLGGMMKRTLLLPMEIIQPLLPGTGSK